MTRRLTSVLFLASALVIGHVAHAQLEGPVPTQVLVTVEAKSTSPANAAALTVAVNDRKEPLTAWEPLTSANAQVALLIDDGLRESVGREIDNLCNFVRTLSPGVEILVGYMQYGHIVTAQSFTIDHALAASTIHLPDGMAGMSASPYICISDFVKNWPGPAPSSSPRKARFIIMLTNGVDPYNGSTSIMNQGSPYVDNAIEDAQRAGVAIYSIYFSDAGIIGGMADNSGQNYLSQITQATGGVNYWEGVGNPVSTTPFLRSFQDAIAETYIATFLAPTGNNPARDLVRIKVTAAKVKLHAPAKVRPGNVE
ncbi:MAG TPA: hypothetical protein VMQ60_10005 [Acidobacteriaceae bacterium]|jgi:hypothetical protein|nr:hypothetical protein [Acidobacteriaceae bacterium]